MVSFILFDVVSFHPCCTDFVFTIAVDTETETQSLSNFPKGSLLARLANDVCSFCCTTLLNISRKSPEASGLVSCSLGLWLIQLVMGTAIMNRYSIVST